MGTKVNLYKQSGTDDGTSVNFNLPRSLTYGLNARANDDGGVTESDNCEYNTLNGLSTLLKSSSLIITPNSYKEGKLYSVIPSDGSGDMSVVRATTATRVNAAGLVELVPYNLFTYSQTFSNADWTKNNVTLTGGQSGYDGSSNAFLLTDNSTNDVHVVRQTPIVSGQYTISVYAKANTLNFVWLRGVQNSANVRAWFNLSTGAVGTVETNGTATIESVGNGWYRCSLTIADFQSGFESYIGASNANGTISYVGSGQSIYIQNAQSNLGLIKPYQRTETRLNIPRLDYSNGSCPSLLVEPQRTNISNYIESGTGNWQAATVTSANSILGLKTFNVITDGVIFGDQPHINSNSEFQANSKYTCSFYTDFSQCTGISITCNLLGFFPTVALASISINKTTKAITTQNVGGVWTIDSSSATQINGEIYKISFTATPNLTSIAGSRTYIFGNLAGRFAGIQLEAGAYGTSFINKPTSASVTRNADVISKTGISSLIGQTEGTVFIDYIWNNNATDVIPIAINGNDGKFIWFRLNGVQFYGNSSALLFSYVPANGTYNQRYKLAFVYGQNDFRIFINGALVASQTTGTFTGTFDSFTTTPIGSSPFNESTKHNAIALWKTALTDDQLEALTGTSFNTYAEMASYYNYTLQ
jgi:hypothetical protein